MKAPLSSQTAFKRQTLVEQITNRLREDIRNGSLTGQLPPERILCEQLHASRPIVRRAIHHLRDEGMLHLSSRQPARIVKSTSQRRRTGSETKVVLLFAAAPGIISQWPLMVIDQMRREFTDKGIRFDIVMEPALGRKQIETHMHRLVSLHRASHWILAGPPLKVQEWFRGKPYSVTSMGNSFPEAHIPYVNDDLRGVTRHAASVFLGLGHRKIVFLMRDRGLAGEALEENGFRDAFTADNATACSIIKHQGRVDSIRERLERIFTSQSDVTAILVSHAEDTIVVINWFWEQGIKVPEDVSLISFEWAGFLERIRPRPAWYYSDPKEHARKICRLVLRSPGDTRSPRLVFPKFVKNGAVSHPRKT